MVRLPKLLEELSRLLEALKSAIGARSDDEVIIETAESLWTIVDEAMDVVETVDFEALPEAIDVEELPDAIEAEKLSSALEAGDAAEVIDLAELYEAIDLRELWRTVDRPALRREGAELEEEIAVFLDDGEHREGSEPNGSGILNVRDATSGLFGAESRQQALQQRIDEAIDAFRVALLETHATVRRLYEANQRKHGQSGRRSDSRSRSPTAYSTLPRRPLPGPSSTRASTVPTRVRHSRTKGRPRIYGRRFERTVGRESRYCRVAYGGCRAETRPADILPAGSIVKYGFRTGRRPRSCVTDGTACVVAIVHDGSEQHLHQVEDW